MGLFSSFLSKVLGGGGSKAASNLLSEVVVTGARNAASTGLSSALGKAVGTGLASGLGAGAGQALAGRSSGTPKTAPSGETTVDEVVVTPQARPQVANLGSSLVPAGLSNMASSLAFDDFSEPAPAYTPPPALANTVAPVTVTPAALSEGQGGLAALAGGGGAGAGSALADALTPVEVTDALKVPEEEDDGGLLKKGGLLAALGLGGLGLKELLGMGLLGSSLGLFGGGGKGDPDLSDVGPGAELAKTAANSRNLANMLGQRANANMNGQIGGQGLNAIARMVRNAQAAIRQRYAGMGMSGSTAEQSDLNQAAQSGVDMQFKVGQEMAQTGLNTIAALTGQSANAYAALMNAQLQQDTSLGNAQARFAGAAAALLT